MYTTFSYLQCLYREKQETTYCICLHLLFLSIIQIEVFVVLMAYWKSEKNGSFLCPVAIVSRLHYAVPMYPCAGIAKSPYIGYSVPPLCCIVRVLYFAENLLVISSIRRKASSPSFSREKIRHVSLGKQDEMHCKHYSYHPFFLPIANFNRSITVRINHLCTPSTWLHFKRGQKHSGFLYSENSAALLLKPGFLNKYDIVSLVAEIEFPKVDDSFWSTYYF